MWKLDKNTNTELNFINQMFPSPLILHDQNINK